MNELTWFVWGSGNPPHQNPYLPCQLPRVRKVTIRDSLLHLGLSVPYPVLLEGHGAVIVRAQCGRFSLSHPKRKF